MANDSLQNMRPPPDNFSGIPDSQDPDLIGIDANYEAEDKHNKHEVERLAGLAQDREQRKEYAGKIFNLVCGWLIALIAVICLAGAQCLNLSDSVLIALITGASVNIIGLMVIVTNYLFPKNK